MCRKRPFATHGQGRRPARAAVCRIPCLILCLADVERVGQCRAPNAPGGVHGRMASVIAALVSRSRPPPPGALSRRLISAAATGAAVAATGEAVAAPAKWARHATNQVDSQALKVLYPEYRYPEYRYRPFSTPMTEPETVRSCTQRLRVRQSRRRTINQRSIRTIECGPPTDSQADPLYAAAPPAAGSLH